MSAEAGGGIIGLCLVVAFAEPLITAAVTVLVTGAVVAGAVAVAVGAAQLINSALSHNHETTVQASIARQENNARQDNNTLANQIAQQRQQLLQNYQRSHRRLTRMSDDLQVQRNRIIESANNVGRRNQREIERLRDSANALNSQTTNRLNQQLNTIQRETEQQINAWRIQISNDLGVRRQRFDNELNQLAAVADRDLAAQRFAESLINEANGVSNQLFAEPDLIQLIPGRDNVIRRLSNDCMDLYRNGNYLAAIASSVGYAQLIMETYLELDTERHRRTLLQEEMNLVTAELKAMVDNCKTIELNRITRYPTDANYWSENRLTPIMDRAEELLRESQNVATMPAAEMERILTEILQITEEMRKETNRGRQNFACALVRTQLIRNSKRAFEASGWRAESWGFEDGDFRKALIMRFTRTGGSRADLVLRPVFNPNTQNYEVEVMVERLDSGVIDEGLRRAQYVQLTNTLQNCGVPVRNLSCTAGTAGRNAAGPAQVDRFRIPDPQ